MPQGAGANKYKRAAITTAGRGQILILLYEEAIRSVKKAIIALDNNDRATKGLGIGKAHDIVNELINSLDFKVGGKVAQDLEALYNFMIDQLLKANLENNKEPLMNIQKILEDLLGAWRVAVKDFNKKNGAV